MSFFNSKHLALDYSLKELLETDPTVGIDTVKILNEAWSKHPLSEAQWLEFEEAVHKIKIRDEAFFTYFYQNYVIKDKPEKIIGIFNEMAKVSKILEKHKNIVAAYGSARTKPKSDMFKRILDLFKYLGAAFKKSNFLNVAFLTGGGPGLMAAVNKAASWINLPSIGLKITLPFEAFFNTFVKSGLILNYFFTRIAHFYNVCRWHIILPGGFGTLQEAFSLITLVILKKIGPKAIVFYNYKDFFGGLKKWLTKKTYEQYGLITAEELKQVALAKNHFQIYRALQKKTSTQEISEKKTYPVFKSYLTEKYPQKIKPIQNSAKAWIKDLKKLANEGDPQTKGLVYSFVRHFMKNSSASNEKIFHTLAEYMGAKIVVNGGPKSVTFINTRRIPQHPKHQKIIQEMTVLMSQLEGPIAFDHQESITHTLISGITRNSKFPGDLRIFNTTTPNLPQGLAAPKNIHLNLPFKNHDIKKTVLIDSSKALIFTPGAFESLDIFFEVLCLIQTGKIKKENAPKLIIVGKDYWGDLLSYLIKSLLKFKMIKAEDLDLIHITDSAEEAFALIP